MPTTQTDSKGHTKENKGYLWDGNCDQECLSWLGYYDKHHKMGDLNNPHLSSHGTRDWKSEVRVPAGVSSGQDILPVCRQLPSRYVLTGNVSHLSRERKQALWGLFGKDTDLTWRAPSS